MEILVAVASGMLGMALPAVLEGGPLASLICSVVGMIVRPFVMTAGRRQRLRVTTTVLVTLGALGLQYMGTTFIVSPLSGREILPGSDVLIVEKGPGPEDPETPPVTTTPTTSVTASNVIEMTPDELVCEPGCRLAVTVKNSGDEPVDIQSIEFTGSDKDDFRYEGPCEEEALSGHKECSFVIVFKPYDPTLDSQADLYIHHSRSDSPFIRHVTSHAVKPPQTQPDLRIGVVTCAYVPTNTLRREGVLSVAFSLTLSGSSGKLPKKIAATAAKKDGKPNRVTASAPGKASVSLPITERDYGGGLTVDILVDSDRAVKEANEENNTVQVTVSPPKNPNVKQALDCST